MDWFLLGLFSSLCMAARSDINRRLKLDGFRLNFWRSIFAALIFLPVVCYVPWPSFFDYALFYILSLLFSVVIVISMTIKFNLASQHNGRVANLEGPVKAFAAFFVWLLVDEASFHALADQPLIALGVLSMMLLATYATNGMRDNDSSWQAFMMIAPVGLLLGILDALVKFVMPEEGHVLANISVFMFIMFALGALWSLPIVLMRRQTRQKFWWVERYTSDRPLIVPGMLKAGFLTGLATVLGVGALYLGFIVAPNPGYPAAVVMTTPIWLLLYHKVKGIPDDASPFMGTLMVLSGIGLVIITSFK